LGPPVSAPLPKKKFPSQRFVVKFQKLFCQPFLCNVSLQGSNITLSKKLQQNFFAKAVSDFFCVGTQNPSGIPISQGTNLRVLTNFQALSINIFEKLFCQIFH
jgi:hypothetical protein